MSAYINLATDKLIRSWEKKVLKVYLDSGRVKTAGVGHTGPEINKLKVGTPISNAQAEAWYREDVLEAVEAVAKAVKVPLGENQRGTLVSFAFNVGVGAFAGSTLVRKLNARDYKSVPKELARWVHDNGKVVQGLVNRRNAEIKLWNTPDDKAAPKEAVAPQSVPQGIPSGEVAKVNIWTKPETVTSLATGVGVPAISAMAGAQPLNVAIIAAFVLVLVGVGVFFINRKHNT